MRRNLGIAVLLLVVSACSTVEEETPRILDAEICTADVCTAVVRKLAFREGLTDTADGVIPGFDLDGVDSGSGGENGCSNPDFVSPDGVPGIDNQIGDLLKKVGDVIVILDDLVAEAINQGRLLYAIELGIGGTVDPYAKMRKFDGIPLLGNDVKILSGQTFAVDATYPEIAVSYEIAAEGTTVTIGPFELDMPIQILDVDEVLRSTNTMLRFQVDEQGNFRNGVIGGGLVIAGIIDIINNYAVGDEIRAIVPTLLENLSDLAPDEYGECTALSYGLQFDAVKAFVLTSETQE